MKWAANSPVAMLDQYVANLKTLKGIALDIGLQDSLITSNQVLVEALKRFGVAHTFETYEGDHGNRIPSGWRKRSCRFLEHFVIRTTARELASVASAFASSVGGTRPDHLKEIRWLRRQRKRRVPGSPTPRS